MKKKSTFQQCMITFAGNIDHLIAHLKTRCYRFRQPETEKGDGIEGGL